MDRLAHYRAAYAERFGRTPARLNEYLDAELRRLADEAATDEWLRRHDTSARTGRHPSQDGVPTWQAKLSSPSSAT